MTETIAILGAGAWGSSLGKHLAQRHHARLWARDGAHAKAIIDARSNQRYLPGIVLPSSLEVTADLEVAIAGATLIVVATPIVALNQLVSTLLARCTDHPPLVWLCKGFIVTDETVVLPHQAIAARWPKPVAVVSGPSFAEEVAHGLPTAVTVASADQTNAEAIARTLRSDTFRVYVSDDMIGVEVGGAIKNVLAIAAGACDGLGFGHNARAALITRGLAETGRLSLALGGKRETLMGLAGLGDLVLTCTGDLSRNRRVGLGLAQGKPLADILAELGHVAEGIAAAHDVVRLATKHGIDMPICTAVDRVLHHGLPPRQAVAELLRREAGAE